MEKKWFEIDGSDEVLNRFGELIDVLKEEEVELIIDLTRNYHWLSYQEYHSTYHKLLIQLYHASLSAKNKLYVFNNTKEK